MSDLIFNGFKILCKPWWTETMFENSKKGICCARVHAEKVSVTEIDSRGDSIRYMLDLTEADLNILLASDGYADLENDHFCGSIDDIRPSKNNLNCVATEQDRLRAYEILQNEGFIEDKIIDKTPWQKGDDCYV